MSRAFDLPDPDGPQQLYDDMNDIGVISEADNRAYTKQSSARKRRSGEGFECKKKDGD